MKEKQNVDLVKSLEHDTEYYAGMLVKVGGSHMWNRKYRAVAQTLSIFAIDKSVDSLKCLLDTCLDYIKTSNPVFKKGKKRKKAVIDVWIAVMNYMGECDCSNRFFNCYDKKLKEPLRYKNLCIAFSKWIYDKFCISVKEGNVISSLPIFNVLLESTKYIEESDENTNNRTDYERLLVAKDIEKSVLNSFCLDKIRDVSKFHYGLDKIVQYNCPDRFKVAHRNIINSIYDCFVRGENDAKNITRLLSILEQFKALLRSNSKIKLGVTSFIDVLKTSFSDASEMENGSESYQHSTESENENTRESIEEEENVEDTTVQNIEELLNDPDVEESLNFDSESEALQKNNDNLEMEGTQTKNEEGSVGDLAKIMEDFDAEDWDLLEEYDDNNETDFVESFLQKDGYFNKSLFESDDDRNEDIKDIGIEDDIEDLFKPIELNEEDFNFEPVEGKEGEYIVTPKDKEQEEAYNEVLEVLDEKPEELEETNEPIDTDESAEIKNTEPDYANNDEAYTNLKLVENTDEIKNGSDTEQSAEIEETQEENYQSDIQQTVFLPRETTDEESVNMEGLIENTETKEEFKENEEIEDIGTNEGSEGNEKIEDIRIKEDSEEDKSTEDATTRKKDKVSNTRSRRRRGTKSLSSIDTIKSKFKRDMDDKK